MVDKDCSTERICRVARKRTAYNGRRAAIVGKDSRRVILRRVVFKGGVGDSQYSGTSDEDCAVATGVARWSSESMVALEQAVYDRDIAVRLYVDCRAIDRRITDEGAVLDPQLPIVEDRCSTRIAVFCDVTVLNRDVPERDIVLVFHGQKTVVSGRVRTSIEDDLIATIRPIDDERLLMEHYPVSGQLKDVGWLGTVERDGGTTRCRFDCRPQALEATCIRISVNHHIFRSRIHRRERPEHYSRQRHGYSRKYPQHRVFPSLQTSYLTPSKRGIDRDSLPVNRLVRPSRSYILHKLVFRASLVSSEPTPSYRLPTSWHAVRACRRRACAVMSWVLVIVAGLLEVVMAISLKQSDGFRQVQWSASFLFFAVASFGLLSFALRSMQVGTAYAVWTGIGAAGTAIVGMAVLGDPRDAVRVIAIAVIICGVIMLRLAS